MVETVQELAVGGETQVKEVQLVVETAPELTVGGEIQIKETATVEDALHGAYSEAGATGGRVFPAVMFRQGGRTNLSMAMTLGNLAQLVRRQSARAGSDPRESINRPLMPEHSKTIEDYLVKNSAQYILPSVTLTTSTDLSVYTIQSPAPLRAAWVVIGDGTQFLVTDGQHRLAALTGSAEHKTKLRGALYLKPELAEDGIAVHLVFEKARERIHQDFADAAQSKQIPPSMLAAFNTREPFNRVLGGVAERSQFLSGRVDMTSKTLGKNSTKIFLLNQVRGFLKELIMGDYAASEEAVARTSVDRLEKKEFQDAYIDRAVRLLDGLAANMSPWDQVLKIDVGSTAANRIPALREQYLNLTATGLNLIGRVGYEVFKNTPEDQSERERYFARLAEVDWRKTSKLWQGSVIAPDTTKVLTARASLSRAFATLRAEIGMPANW